MGFKALLMPPAIVASGSASASFTYVNDYPTSVLTVGFTDTSTGATDWFWDFGDGNTSTSQNPSRTYATAGHYLVELQINGGAVSTSQTIPVDAFHAAVTAAGFARFYDYRETSGTAVTNSGTDGIGGNGQINNSPTLGVADPTGNPDAFTFTASNQNVTNPAKTLTATDFTIVSLVRGNGATPAGTLFNGSGGDEVLTFGAGGGFGDGAFACELSTENGLGYIYSDPAILAADTWYLLVVRWNFTTGVLDLRYSSDGTLQTPSIALQLDVLPSALPAQLTGITSWADGAGNNSQGATFYTPSYVSDLTLTGIAESIWP